ncbi:MAG: prepilin peptidase [Candidatus Dormibacteria bacterium]
MNALVIAAAVVAGAVIGLGSGWLGVRLERIEKLHEEEEEERLQYERDVHTAREAAVAAAEEPPTAEPWMGERYSWTWLEFGLGPAATALGFGLFTMHAPVDAGLLIHLLWVAVFAHIVVFDLKHRLILNRVTYPAMVVALGIAQVSPGLTFVRAVIGFAAIAVFFVLLNLISRSSIGLGDAKLGALVGAVTGLSADPAHLGAAYAATYAIFLGAGAALLLLVTRLRHLKDPIPYGPFLCAGAAIILYQGP